MFLHLGADTVIPLREIVAITDMKTAKYAVNLEFLKRMKEDKRVRDISEGSPKSFVVTEKNVFLSAISAATLKKRAELSPDGSGREE